MGDPVLVPNECEHGHLRRKCLICELAAELTEVRHQLVKALADGVKHGEDRMALRSSRDSAVARAERLEGALREARDGLVVWAEESKVPRVPVRDTMGIGGTWDLVARIDALLRPSPEGEEAAPPERVVINNPAYMGSPVGIPLTPAPVNCLMKPNGPPPPAKEGADEGYGGPPEKVEAPGARLSPLVESPVPKEEAPGSPAGRCAQEHPTTDRPPSERPAPPAPVPEYMTLPGNGSVSDAVMAVLGTCAIPYSCEQVDQITRFIHERDKSRDAAIERIQEMGAVAPVPEREAAALALAEATEPYEWHDNPNGPWGWTCRYCHSDKQGRGKSHIGPDEPFPHEKDCLYAAYRQSKARGGAR